MALILKDRVKETTAVTGTGNATLLGPVLGYQGFSVVGTGNTTYYCISNDASGEWEVGIGTFTAPDQLSRDTVLSSSNAGALVPFAAAVKNVFVTYPSEKGVWLDASGNVISLGTINSATWNAAIIDVPYGGTGANTAATARTNLGLEINVDVQGYVTPGASGNLLTSNGTAWTSAAPGAAVAAGGAIWVNNELVSSNVTIATGQNGFMVGPMATASGVTVTVASGQRLVII